MPYFLRCKVIGTGKPGDAFRVEFPTYIMRDIDYNARIAVIEVPDGVLPAGLPTQKTPDPANPVTQIDVVAFTPQALAAIEQRVKADYSGAFPDWKAANITPGP